MSIKILIVEDQFIEGNNLRIILRSKGYVVTGIASSVEEAFTLIEESKPDIVMLDIYLQGSLTGIDLASVLKNRNIAFIFLSANSDKKTLDAAKATKPYGFLVKPFRQKDVLVMVEVALYLHKERNNTTSAILRSDIASATATAHMVGDSPVMQELKRNINIVGPSETSVLILGESGTGKELVAKSIHQSSHRSAKPVVVVNCGALPANLIESELFGHEKGSFTGATEKRVGKFEQAQGGTIFLDEIGELPLDLQVKFLRVLQEKEIEPIGGKKKIVDVRVIAATNRTLEDEIAKGRFRLDLYYRLNIFPILIPPLRERKEDIPALAQHFINFYARKENKIITGFSHEAMNTLIDYTWPGNIRELENLMARTALISSGGIVTSIQTNSTGKPNMVQATAQDLSFKPIVEHEKEYLLAALIKCNWKIHGTGGAAEMLQINESTLRSRLKKYGIEKQSGIK